MDRESQGRERDELSFVCSWCPPTLASTCGLGCGDLINYGICARCLQSKLVALSPPALRQPAARYGRSREFGQDERAEGY